MFIIQGLLKTPSLVLYGSKNRLKTCEQFVLLDPQNPIQRAQLTSLLPFYRMRRLNKTWSYKKKKYKKIEGYRKPVLKELTDKTCLVILALNSFRLYVKRKHSMDRNFQSLPV